MTEVTAVTAVTAVTEVTDVTAPIGALNTAGLRQPVVRGAVRVLAGVPRMAANARAVSVTSAGPW